MRKHTVVKKVVFGTISFQRGKKIEREYKNAWCCYVRGEDIGQYVSKVVFTLHDSFREHIMVVHKPPFCITRAGWGQFDIMVTIHFFDPSEEPISKSHFLKLYHDNKAQSQTSKKPVLNEQYDEIVFYEPTEYFNGILTGKINAQRAVTPEITQEEESKDPVEKKEEEKDETSLAHPHDLFDKGTFEVQLNPEDEQRINISDHFQEFSEAEDVKKLDQGIRFITEENASLKEKLAQTIFNLKQAHNELREKIKKG